MATWNSVNGVEDGEPVCAETFNRPIGELTSRTDYLKSILDDISGIDSVKTTGARLKEGEKFAVGDIVCIDPETKLYTKAISSMSLYDAYTASEKAYAVGMLVDFSGTSGTIVFYGKIDLSDMDVDGMLDKHSGEFVNGQYYLSSTTAGKITRYPTGPRISLGFFSRNEAVSGKYPGDFAILNPQYMDIEAHSHRTFVLAAKPAGVVDYEGDPSDDVPMTAHVSGYPPIDDAPGAPRLTVCGDWTIDKNATYTIKLDNGSGDTPTSWPCRMTWSGVGDDTTSGTVEVRFFGEEIPIGKYGLAVRFEAGVGNGPESPYTEEVDEASRTWSVDHEMGRGWTSASANVVETFGDNHLRLTGTAEKTVEQVYAIIPGYIFDLTASIPSISSGDTLSIGGEEFIFVDESYEGETDATKVYIADNVMDTLVSLAEKSNSVVLYDDTIGQVLAGFEDSDGVKFKEKDGEAETLSPVLSGADYVLFFDMETKKSLAVPKAIGSVNFSVVLAEHWAEVPLANGLTVTFVGNEDFSVGALSQFYVESGVPGSVYRYAIEFDNDLKKHFPPVPAKSGSLMLNGVELESYELYGKKAVFGIGGDSIYWLDPAYGRAPWPEAYVDSEEEVPIDDQYRLLFHFVSEFHSETGPVTSLHSAEGSPIKVFRCGTDEPASVGDLSLDLRLELDASDSGEKGYKVVKRTRNGRLLLGPVVERIVAGPGISISKTSNVPDGQGTVMISADGTMYNGDFETVALENAKLESVGMFPYIRLLKWDGGSSSNIPTGFVAKFHVPATAYVTMYRVKFYATVFGEESFEGQASPLNAGVRMDYNILPDFGAPYAIPTISNLKEDLISPDSAAVLNIPFGSQSGNGYEYKAFDPMLVHNDSSIDDEYGRSYQVYGAAFPNNEDCSNYCSKHQIVGSFGILPGYTVAIRFSRTAPTAGSAYTAPIGFLNLRWSIEAVTTIDSGNLVFSTDQLVEQTVMKLRKVALNDSIMNKDYDVVSVIQKLLNALRG